MLLAIDPGPTQSAIVAYSGTGVLAHGILPNDNVLRQLQLNTWSTASEIAIEGIACYGMPVGKETFDTCIWIGRFIEAGDRPWSLVYRPDVKLHLCKSARAKDANVRQALIDRFGPGKQAAIGTKKSPGPLHGITSHCWSALAVAVTYWDTRLTEMT